ncbi:hypothetical protein TNCV_845951 [Trichonephila clavipes]|nr:hypothetical protein TNCV_845951 [Trichonephila clavipes]
MARKKSKSIQRKGQGTPGRILNPERPPSTWTESSRSISPLIDGTTRMTIDEPTDLELPPSIELTLTLQEKVCRKRVLLTSRLTTMESGIDDIRNIINNYKENGHDASSFLIQEELKIKEHFEKERQQLVSELSSLPPCDIPICAIHPKSPVKLIPQEFPRFPLQRRQNVKKIQTVSPTPAKENNPNL